MSTDTRVEIVENWDGSVTTNVYEPGFFGERLVTTTTQESNDDLASLAVAAALVIIGIGC